ncbi:GNAT family N-acetyltransferase [Paenibacillus spongiae]|uniref:N-acetyltransferase n=1 Tax=Paenibacillus spongiae TaxID=2909671 RepID=A0ABY5S982_9BACL|nr:GNAT family N-acetyltransferase [Paenibacillus spongiae]UVI30486.1 N-acetyltransferase [Paenibacillus spongiae]
MYQVEHNTDKHQFFIQDNGELIAEMTYSVTNPSLYIIDHTYVNDNYRGQGLADQLLTHFIDYARKHEIKLMPLCPFAKKQFDTKPEYADVRY